jgi:hypothetical protein
MALRLLRRYGSTGDSQASTGWRSTGWASTDATISASSLGQHERHETTEYKARECLNFKRLNFK